MIITHKLTIDLCRRGVSVNLDMVQGDSNTRNVEITLTAAGVSWDPPSGTTAAVAFLKPDGTKGLYDKLPDGGVATSISGNTITAIMAPQVLTCTGVVIASVVLHDKSLDSLATFPFQITVAKNPAAGGQISNDYYAYSTMEEVSEAVEAAIASLEKAKEDFLAEAEKAQADFLSKAEDALSVVHGAATEDAPAIVCGSTGQIVQVADASNRVLHGLTLYGKTTQNGTPTPENPVELESVGDDGSVAVTVCGKNLYDASTILSSSPASNFVEINNDKYRIYSTKEVQWVSSKSKVITLSAGVTYTLSGTVDALVHGTPGISLRNTSSKLMVSATPTAPGRYYCKYTPTKDVDVYVSLFATGSTAEIGDVTYSNVQLEVGSTMTDYEPYKDGGALTIPTPNGLPGIPVTSGGNYTDDSGQQWVCDEVDFEKGVYVQRIYCYTFTGQEVLNSFDSGKTLGRDIKHWGLPSCIVPKKNSESNVSPMLCTHGAVTTQIALKNDSGGIAVSMWGDAQFLYFSGTSYGSVDVLKTAMAEAYASGTPYVWMYALETPIETALSAEELAQYAALHTNKPNTTVYNDAGAGMKVEYVADTKLYIDQKLAAISAALLNA